MQLLLLTTRTYAGAAE